MQVLLCCVQAWGELRLDSLFSHFLFSSASPLTFPSLPLFSAQMYALLAITVALSPASQKLLDENVMTQLRDRNAEKIARMVRGDVAVFDERFSYACPKVSSCVSLNR